MASESIQIVRPDPTAMINEIAPIVLYAKSLDVTDVDSDRKAQEIGQQLRRAERKWTEMCEPARAAADQAKKAILALRDGILGPWAEARSIVFAKSDAYQADQRRIAEEETRRLQELARKEEEERQIQAAIEAEAQGDAATSEAILAEPVSAPVVIVAPAVAKVEGVSSMTRWSAELHDSVCKLQGCQDPRCRDEGLIELVKYVAAHPEWISLLEPSMPNLNRLAVAQRQSLNIPGVRAVSKTIRSTH